MMNQRPRYLGELFHRIVWMLAVPVAGCGSSVTPAGEADAAAEAGVDVVAPIDRSQGADVGYDAGPPIDRGRVVDAGYDAGTPVDTGPIDAGYDAATPVDTGPIDAGPVDAGAPDVAADARECSPRPGPGSPATCEETVHFPCGLPPGARVDAGSFIPSQQCMSLCEAARSGFNSGCRRLAPLADGTDRVACTTCAVGRRTEGLGPIRGARESGPLGDFFARVATLEWASVTAFERLADDLARCGAPADLVAEARRSADDERRHTRSMGALAERFGAPVRAPEFTGPGERSLEAIALENAAEGCVRETFGALVATWQARAARDGAVAEAMRGVAADETRHAEFSWALDRWADGELDAGARARVRAARAEAAATLGAELDAAVDPSLVATAGLPDRDTARALFSAMTAAFA